MNVKISEDKLNLLKNLIFDGLEVHKYDSFQPRSVHDFYVEFLTPKTRKNVISRYYQDINLVVVNDEKFYDLISEWFGSHKIYDMIKDDMIKSIYKVYTDRFREWNYGDIRTIKYKNNEQFN